VSLSPEDSVELEAVALDHDGKPLSGVKFEWSSSDAEVARATGGGVSAVSGGTARIVARSAGVESAPASEAESRSRSYGTATSSVRSRSPRAICRVA
jgi:hypothetical protein